MRSASRGFRKRDVMNNDQRKQSNRRWSFTQEMHQAFLDWVKKLPFIKRDLPDDADRAGVEDASGDRPTAPHPAEGTPAGRSPGSRESPR